MRRLPIFCSLFLVLTQFQAFALEAVVNHALFFDQKGKAYTEIYWQVNTQKLRYKKDAGGSISTRINTVIRVLSDSAILYQNAYPLQTTPFNPTQSEAPTILDIAKAFLPKGWVRIELTLYEDGLESQAFHYQDSFLVRRPDHVFYSSLQLLDTSFESKVFGPFAKAGYQQLPRCLNFFDEGQQRLNFYTELYQEGLIPKGHFPLTQKFWISHDKGVEDLQPIFITDTIKVANQTDNFRHHLSLATLGSGNYYLNASLKDNTGTELANGATFFQLINSHPLVFTDSTKGDTANAGEDAENILNLGRTFVAKYNMAQLRAILKMMIPTASPSELNTINGFLAKPDEIFIRYFIYNYFALQDKKDPEKAWKIFTAKVKECNKYYSVGGRMGYETDRGRVYLRFGEPAEVLRVPNEAGAYPYEIWRYNAGGEITTAGIFLFYTPPSAIGNMILLHSTVLGQTYNPNWRAELYLKGVDYDYQNSKAEQIISGR